MSNFYKKIGNLIWVLLCTCLIIVNIILINKCFKHPAGDMEVWHSTIMAVEDGKNPYLVEDIRQYYDTKFPCGWPPVGFFLVKMMNYPSRFFGVKLNYYILWYLFILGTFFIVKKAGTNFKPLFLLTLLMTGFVTSYFNFATGNQGLMDLFILSIVFYWIIKNRYYWSAFFAALPGLLRPYNLVYEGLFIFSKISKAAKIKIYLLVAVLLILTQVLSWVFFPKICPTYYQVLFNQLPQHSPLKEGGGICNPALIFLIKSVVDRLLGGNFIIFLSLYLLFIIFITRLFLNYIKDNKQFLYVFSLGVLTLMIILPRLKPYSFVFALLPIYFLVENLGLKAKFLTILTVSVWPLLFLIFTPTIELSSNIVLRALWHYNQSLALLLFFIVYVVVKALSSSPV